MCIALDTTTTPGVSEKKCTTLQYCHHGFLHQQGKSKALATPSTQSGDNGVTKHFSHPLWQLKWHHGGGGVFWLCRRHSSPGCRDGAGDANSQILHKGSLP